MEHGFKGTSVEGSVGIVHVAPHTYQTQSPWHNRRILGV